MSDVNYQVEWRYGLDQRWEHPVGQGRVIGRCDAPQVLIETPDGRKFWWRADLTRRRYDFETVKQALYTDVDDFPTENRHSKAEDALASIEGRLASAEEALRETSLELELTKQEATILRKMRDEAYACMREAATALVSSDEGATPDE